MMPPRLGPSWTLSGRIVRRGAAAVMLTGALIAFMAAAVSLRGIERLAAARASTSAAVLAAAGSDPVERLDIAALRKLLAGARQARDLADVLAFDAHGRVLTDGTLANPRRHHEVPPKVAAVLERGEPSVGWQGKTVVALHPIRVGSTVTGGIECTVALQPYYVQALWLAGALLGTGLLFTALVAGLASRGARDALLPLRRLQSSVEALTEDRPGAQLPGEGPEEILGLARSFATLRNRLKATTVSRNVMASILDGVGEGFLVVGGDGRVEQANAVAGALLGSAPDHLEGRPITELVEIDEHGKSISHLVRAAMEMPARTHHGRGRLRPAGGSSELPVLVSLRATVRVGGEGLMLVCLLRDISDLKRVEAMKERFLATVSHELRTPLTSITGSLALLAEGTAGELPPKAARMAEIALANSQRLDRLIGDLLDLQQASEGRLSLTMTREDVGRLIADAVDAARGQADAAGVDVQLECSGQFLTDVDPGRLNQVACNLLSNAIKHGPRGTTVEVVVRAVSSGVRVEVADRGPGVPEAFVPFLFERFTQANLGGRPVAPGSGLGLALARDLVERMGGTIGYSPRDGGGAVFWFEIPKKYEGAA